MTHAFKEALWLRVFLGFLNLPVPRPFPILSDNQAACSLSSSTAISARSKHIDICHHFICAHVLDGSVATTWICNPVLTSSTLFSLFGTFFFQQLLLYLVLRTLFCCQQYRARFYSVCQTSVYQCLLLLATVILHFFLNSHLPLVAALMLSLSMSTLRLNAFIIDFLRLRGLS